MKQFGSTSTYLISTFILRTISNLMKLQLFCILTPNDVPLLTIDKTICCSICLVKHYLYIKAGVSVFHFKYALNNLYRLSLCLIWWPTQRPFVLIFVYCTLCSTLLVNLIKYSPLYSTHPVDRTSMMPFQQ